MKDDPLSAWDKEVGATAQLGPIMPLPEHSAQEQANRPARMLEWMQGLGISEETVAMAGLYVYPRRFQADPASDKRPALVFPYRFRNQVVNRGYRHPAGWAYEYEAEAVPTLFNADAVDEANPQEIVWAQREMDVLALHEAGFPQSVSLQQIGKPIASADPSDVVEEDRRFLAIQTHEGMLGAARKIILALDAGAVGEELREELARRLGRHRCWIATWPEGSETPGQVLKAHGREALQKAIAEAEPYPIEGMYRVSAETLLGLRRRKKPPTMGTGVGALNQILKLPTDGRLIVTIGIPNHGKTPFVRHLAVHTMQKHDRRWAVFSPEMRPWERFAASCAEWLTGKRFFAPTGRDASLFSADETMTDDEVAEAARWLRSRLVMLVNDAEREQPTVDWILEMAKMAVLRDGVTDLWIDPWNELSHQRPTTLREDEYIGQSLQRFLAFGNRHGCNCWINVHPVTMRLKPGEKMQPPGPYDIAGGAMWFNKADLMLTVHRPADTPLSQIIVRKAKDMEWGRRGDHVDLAYNVTNGRYSTPDATARER